MNKQDYLELAEAMAQMFLGFAFIGIMLILAGTGGF